jgi:hypothetical protein
MKHLLFLVCLLVFSYGCASKDIYNVDNESVPIYNTENPPTIDTVKESIMSACKRKGWSPRVVEEGLIEAFIYVRGHKAVVEIPFTEKVYSIHYKDSENLGYSNGKIHRNYNKWVFLLSQTIQQEIESDV